MKFPNHSESTVQNVPSAMQYKWNEEADHLLQLGMENLFDALIEVFER